VLAALVIIGGMAVFIWLEMSVPRLDRVPNPERALTLMVGRMMDLEEAIARAPAWEQALYELTSGGRGYDLAQAITWVDELVTGGTEPPMHLSLAVLHGEAGDLEWLRSRLAAWQHVQEPFPTYARIVSGAYLDARMAKPEEIAVQAELAEALPEGWFYDRLSANLAITGGDATLLASAEAAMVRRGEPLLQRTRLMGAIESLVIVVGIVILVMWRQRATDAHRGWLKVGEAYLPPLWRGRTGLAVMLRGGALGVIVIAVLLWLGTEDPLIRLAVIPASNLPLIFFAQRYLFAPAGKRLGTGVGIVTTPGSRRRIGVAVIAILAVGLLGEWLIDRMAVPFDKASHWTEWFDPDLVWGEPPMVALSLLEYVVFAPFFEELVFRGLLFATLRRRFPWGPSAFMSAAIFAAAHGYGLLGFASVLWSGMIWAWAYEKTGSLIPGIAAHAINNLMVCLTLLALLRW